VGVLSYREDVQHEKNEQWVSHTYVASGRPLFIFVKPLLTAEANQRAFLLNGDESYKIAEVYNLAIPI
jgi:hypothetical protein